MTRLIHNVRFQKPSDAKPTRRCARSLAHGALDPIATVGSHVLASQTIAAANGLESIAGSLNDRMAQMQRESPAFNRHYLELHTAIRGDNRRFSTCSKPLQALHDIARHIQV